MDYKFQSLGPTLNVVVLVFLLVFACVALAVLAGVAALPGRIARSRSHPQADAINICGWVGLPTGILWALALVWAFVRSPKIGGVADHGTPPESSSNMSAQLTQALLDQVTVLEKAVAALETNRQKGKA